MNSCMRQQGQMKGMRNNFTPGTNCSEMGNYRQNLSMDCVKENNNEKKYPIAMAYVPWQKWRDVVDGCKGLAQGTIFNELALNFGCANKNCGGDCIPENLPYNSNMQNVINCGCVNKW